MEADYSVWEVGGLYGEKLVQWRLVALEGMVEHGLARIIQLR